MTPRAAVECRVRGLRPAFGTQKISFRLGDDLRLALEGSLGPRGLSATSADLIDIAASVYQIERQLRGRNRTNPPARLELKMKLRDARAWDKTALSCTVEMLRVLGNAVWELDFSAGPRTRLPDFPSSNRKGITQIALFSGGVDSTCGAAMLSKKTNQTQLVSFYTRQKELQKGLAAALGYTDLAQWRMIWSKEPGRNHSFYYRSFLFLSLAAAVAESWGAKRIIQFENGVLASAIPPAPVFSMTKHAHPMLHQLASNLFSSLFGGTWEIKNPFLTETKRGCFRKAQEALGHQGAKDLLQKTETCWYHWSNRVIGGGKKDPGKPCGICIPCIIRRTAFDDGSYAYDLNSDKVRNDESQGLAFRSYCGFVKRIMAAGSSPSRFYEVLPAAGRTLLGKNGAFSLEDLHQLFSKFSGEFVKTFPLG